MKSSNITENGRTDNTMPTDKRQIDTQWSTKHYTEH
jgi:hypothetical protein